MEEAAPTGFGAKVAGLAHGCLRVTAENRQWDRTGEERREETATPSFTG